MRERFSLRRAADCCWLSRTDACKPCLELGQVGNLAAEADVAVGANSYQSCAGGAHEPMDCDVGPESQVLEAIRVAVQQDVHARPGEQGVQPDMVAAGGDGRVGQPM